MIQGGCEVVAASEMWAPDVITYATNLCRYGELQFHFVEEAARLELERELKRSYKLSGLRWDGDEIVQDEKFHGAPVPVCGTGWIASQPDWVPGVKHVFVGDCRKLASKTILDALGMERGDLDIVGGGPPCQGYSTASKRDVMDPRNSLVFEYARFIIELHPKSMVMEEVPAILTMNTPDGHNVIDKFCRILEDGGFGGVEAFRKAIEQQTGNIGLLRGVARKNKKKVKIPKKGKSGRKYRPPAQKDLF